jgi:CelD/BcsL family acetyltransferase involved in cellulose biosynthesis
VLTITYHADLEEVQCDPALAGALARTAGVEKGCAPFDRMAWWMGLQRFCAMAPMLVVARDGDDLAALPLARVKDGLAGLANWYTFRLRPWGQIQPCSPALRRG